MEVRKDLSQVLSGEVEEEREKLQEAKLNIGSSVPLDAVDIGGPVAAVDSDLLDWLGGCLDADSLYKVCVCDVCVCNLCFMYHSHVLPSVTANQCLTYYLRFNAGFICGVWL